MSLEATIREVDFMAEEGGKSLNLKLSGPGGLRGWQVVGTVEVEREGLPLGWVDKVGRLTGVVSGSGDDRERLNFVGFRVPSMEFVEIEEDRVENAFEEKALGIEEVFRYNKRGSSRKSNFLHVEGVATFVREGQGFYLGRIMGGCGSRRQSQSNCVRERLCRWRRERNFSRQRFKQFWIAGNSGTS